MAPTLILYDKPPLALAVTAIRYLQGSGNYSIFHRSAGRCILVSQTLKRWQEKLPTFWRISQSYLVNPAFIDWRQIPSRHKPTLRLTSGEELRIARRRWRIVSHWLAQQRLSDTAGHF